VTRIERLPKRELTGKDVKALRTSMGITQVAFAKQIGVTTVTVSRWEHDHSHPEWRHRKRIYELAEMVAAVKADKRDRDRPPDFSR